MQGKQKVITILGVGGHGSSTYRDFVTNPLYADYKINLVLGVDDSGGHTGELQRVLPLMDINIDSHFILPFGDLRANIERFVFDLEEDDQLAKEKIDNMSGAYKGTNENEFISKCLEFFRVFGITNDVLLEKFIAFCTNYFRCYQQLDGLENKHKIGNLFLTFMYYFAGLNHEIFFNMLKELGFIPPRVFPHLLFNERLDLTAENLDLGIKFNSEEEVDEAKVPISPSTYVLKKHFSGESLTLEDIEVNNFDVIEAIRSSEMIVLSTGSVANLFGQLNVLADELKASSAIKLWLGNIATTNNEVNFTVLLTYYFSPERLGLDGIVLQMSEAEFDNLTINANDSTWVELYRKQGKTFVNIGDLMSNIHQVFNYNGLAKIINLVQPVLGIGTAGTEVAERIPGWESLTPEERENYKSTLEQGGIKYITTEMTTFIRFFYEFNNFLNVELGISDRSTRYYLISELLKRLRLSEKEDPAAEISIYTELLAKSVATVAELRVKCIKLVEVICDNNPEVNKGELAEILQFPTFNKSDEELRLA